LGLTQRASNAIGTVAITPQAWEAIYWTMVPVGTSVSVGAAIVLHEVPGPDTKV